MVHAAATTDYYIDIEGVGRFRIAKRTMRDELRIQVEYANIIQGVQPTDWLNLVGGWISTLKVLAVESPEGWDIDSLDPLEDDTYRKLGHINAAIAAKEASFRGKSSEGGETGGAGKIRDDTVLVSPQVQSNI